MEPLLFLCHRLPFPPNKGDKVRSYHFLAHLAKRYRIFLGTFIDDPADREHVPAVAAMCAGVRVQTLHPRIRRLASAYALLTGEAMTVPYFHSRALHAWVRETVQRERIARAFAFSSPMAQYLLDVPGLRCCIADFVDVDSAKWADYARRRSWPASAVFRREARRLTAFEQRIAAAVNAVTFVTLEETKLFQDRMPSGAARIATIRNGVDGAYFAPAHVLSPFAADECPIVFTGAMDYWPNVDAVLWFARDVLPEIRKREPRARFHVVGMNPAAAVRSLASDAAVVVTGRVADVRPYLQHARVVVAPLRVARGIQNKVLEAMAMAKAVVVTPGVAAALTARRDLELEAAGEPREFAEKVLRILQDETGAARMGELARARVLADYGWNPSLRQLDELLADDAARTPAPWSPQLDAGIALAAITRR